MKNCPQGPVGNRWLCLARACALALVTWAGMPLPAAAANEPVPAAGDSSAVFIVYGSVYREDGFTPWPDPDTLVVLNDRTLDEVRVALGYPFPGAFALTFVDLDGSAAAKVGDNLIFAFASSYYPLSPDVVPLDSLEVARGWMDVAMRVLESASDAAGGTDPRPLRIDVRPNPSAGRPIHVELRFETRRIMRGDLVLAVQDASGRVVRRIPVCLGGSWRVSVLWDGRDASGRALPPGVYWVRAPGTGAEAAGRTILID